MTDTIRPLFTWRSGIVHSELPSTVKLVALCLSLHMNEMGGSCYPSAGRLAKECSLNPSTIWSCLKRLQEDEWLAVVEHGGQKGDKRRANVYEARVPIAQDDTSASTYRPHGVAPIGEGNTSTSINSTNTSPIVQANGSSTTIGRGRFEAMQVEVCSRCRSTDECKCDEQKSANA